MISTLFLDGLAVTSRTVMTELYQMYNTVTHPSRNRVPTSFYLLNDTNARGTRN